MTVHISAPCEKSQRPVLARQTAPASVAALLVCLAVLLGAAASDAREAASMELPESFATAAERFTATGFGGRNRGQYALGPYRGDFTRIETRWAVFDPLIATNRGKSSFTLMGPELEEPISASCGMVQRTVTVGVFTFDPKKMVYECSFAQGGRPLDASFVLGQPKPENLRKRILALSDRAGESVVDGVRVDIRSVHRYARSRLQSPTAVGYYLELDGRLAGAVELTDINPTLLVAPDEAAEVKRALLVAALSLAVLRDPADSSLGD